MSLDGGYVTNFDMDTGDFDIPTPYYDLRQSHDVAIPVTAGSHLFDVQCSLPVGPTVQTYGSRLHVAWFASTM